MRATKKYILGRAKKIVEKCLNQIGYTIVRMEPENWAERKAGINLSGGHKWINYACGFFIFKDWLNVDAELRFKTQSGYDCLNVNLIGSHPFPDNWFEYGFCEDFIEHLNQSDAIIFLSEVFRTFKKGGVLRLSFPGLEGVLRRYGRDKSFEGYKNLKKDAYTIWGHIHFFSFEELSMVCKHIGFRDIKYVVYGESDHAPLRGLDHREEQKDLNIYMELIK